MEDDNDQTISDLVEGIADALVNEDPDAVQVPDEEAEEPELVPAGLLIASRPRQTGGGTGTGGVPAGPIQGRSPSIGRTGGGSKRIVSRAARRGGLALAAGYALRRGDRESLEQLGLNLDDLQNMNPSDQRLALLNAALGDATHPDDAALRQAANEFLKHILADPPPTPLDALRDFIAALLWRLGLVELKRQLQSGSIDPEVAAQKEKTVDDWIRARLSSEDFGITGAIVTFKEFQRVAARLAATALAILS